MPTTHEMAQMASDQLLHDHPYTEAEQWDIFNLIEQIKEVFPHDDIWKYIDWSKIDRAFWDHYLTCAYERIQNGDPIEVQLSSAEQDQILAQLPNRNLLQVALHMCYYAYTMAVFFQYLNEINS